MAGGLGNQLFQFATGYALARKFNCPLKLDLTRYKSTQEKRQFSLSELNLPFEIAREKEVAQWQHIYRLPKKWMRKWGLTGALYPSGMFLERMYGFDQAINQVRPPIYLYGYWQTEKYFLDLADNLRGIIQTPNLGPPFLSIVERIESQITVSIHIRMGDYSDGSTKNKFSGSCKPDYYHQAIDYMKQFFPSAKFLIFSDNPEQAKSLLTIDPDSLLPSSHHASPIEDLTLMSYCHHHIIANSSFSWWGAWLNTKPGKLVIAPRRWFSRNYLRKHDLYDILPPNWLTLDSYN